MDPSLTITLSRPLPPSLRRQPYETSLRRPYFHVRPLEPSQLTTWAKYLDYSEALGDDAATVRLFERCLVACASYPGARLLLSGFVGACLGWSRG
jgi:hypothetical protein